MSERPPATRTVSGAHHERSPRTRASSASSASSAAPRAASRSRHSSSHAESVEPSRSVEPVETETGHRSTRETRRPGSVYPVALRTVAVTTTGAPGAGLVAERATSPAARARSGWGSVATATVRVARLFSSDSSATSPSASITARRGTEPAAGNAVVTAIVVAAPRTPGPT